MKELRKEMRDKRIGEGVEREREKREEMREYIKRKRE